MPFLLAKKEVFLWLKQGKKTIDVRKGNPKPGETAHFQSGPYSLDLRVVRTECGCLGEVVRPDNFRLVIPSAEVLGDAVAYLRRFYGDYDGVFTAYYLAPL
jgi:ASC-1-like (ASCH) protein